MTIEQKADLAATIHQTLDFCGSTVQATKDWCADVGVAYGAEAEAIRLDAIKSYGAGVSL